MLQQILKMAKVRSVLMDLIQTLRSDGWLCMLCKQHIETDSTSKERAEVEVPLAEDVFVQDAHESRPSKHWGRSRPSPAGGPVQTPANLICRTLCVLAVCKTSASEEVDDDVSSSKA